MKRPSKRLLTAVAAALLGGVLWLTAMILLASTLVATWLPATVGAVFAALTLPAALPRLRRMAGTTCSKSALALRIAAFFAIATPAGMSLLLGLNALTASDSSRKEVEAQITGKHTEQHNTYRTVGRRRIYQGQQTRYYVTVAFPDGHTKKIGVKVRSYVAARNGQRLDVGLRTGVLGLSVIDLGALHSALSAKR